MSDFTPTPTPSYSGKLRNHMLMVPECINECSGIRIFGRTIKSFVFSTDVATIASVNADAVIAVYPFTPQPRIVRAVISVADMPVFCGVGGGFTSGARSVAPAMEAFPPRRKRRSSSPRSASAIPRSPSSPPAARRMRLFVRPSRQARTPSPTPRPTTVCCWLRSCTHTASASGKLHKKMLALMSQHFLLPFHQYGYGNAENTAWPSTRVNGYS